MILYEKKFRLSNGVSFSRYIKTLDELNFSPYTLLISEMPGTKDYRIEIEITDLTKLFWNWHNVFGGGVLFNECTVKHSKGEQFFTLQASIGTGNFLMALIFAVFSLLFLLVILSTTITKGVSSFRDLFMAIIVALVLSAPATFTYIREKKLLDRIGTIGSQLKKK